ncbi:2,3-dihydroxybiphenyl 1,2-dioxygenase [Marinobacterium zhoushanense]|uniref:2,3-dihydroxybiphenyl 1,2-dioxygenase n=1 Tax=Marinobacterium zhoushanense TaxID=1679163 RepID=A0ABQ1K0U8_9GAMM|nr:VOC family protein [Marinobacterium zhoushanense]GGB81392.1 2,3-dihydroxybiphenyl 1,2-dioxygenase [Marinobacterium zhoushanense]
MSVINVKDIAYVRYQAPDLDAMESFLKDFGMSVAHRSDDALYMRGCGEQPFVHVTERGERKTLGFGLLAQSEADLAKLAAHLGSEVERVTEPGGGKRVRVQDPDGNQIDVIYGFEPVERVSVREPVLMNPASGRQRFGEVVRIPPGPSHVMRCGHIALLVADFSRSFAFYREIFGFAPSDTYYAGAPENVVAAFMHCDLGDQFTDHHTLALIGAQDGVARFDHTAFEVIDLDDLMRGNEHLAKNAHEHSWGVGRHVQGSQLFDYWRDPFGHKVEHWTDGDLVNRHTPVNSAALSGGELCQWAPELKPEFFK